MKLLGLRTVSLHETVLPDLTALPPRVGFRDPIHEPVFRELDGRLHLACGQQIVADTVRSKRTVITARVVTCDDDEFTRLRTLDKVWDARRKKDLHAQYRLIARVVELFMPDAAFGPLEPAARGVRGAPVTVKGRAQRMAADAIGCELRTVRRAVAWTRGRPDRTRSKRWAKPFASYGLLPEGSETGRLLAKIQRCMHVADTSVSNALAAITRLQADPNAASLSRLGTLTRIQDNLSLIGRLIRAEVPSSLCPACKGVDGLCDTCAHCSAKGWVGDEELKKWAQAPQLLDESEVCVLVNNQIKRLDEI